MVPKWFHPFIFDLNNQLFISEKGTNKDFDVLMMSTKKLKIYVF
jgi:hypothetical protein